MLRVEKVIGLTLGESWRRATDKHFDYRLAEESLSFYEPEQIPRISPDIPPGVSEVRFRSDLTGQQPADSSCLRTTHGLIASALSQ
jgi:hypothetical protein